MGGQQADLPDLPDNSTRALKMIRGILADLSCDDSGRLPTERDLAERMGIGRRAVRRALDVLEAEGTIWRKHGSGTYMQPPVPRAQGGSHFSGPHGLLHIVETRILLEPALARLAAQRRTAEALQRMEIFTARIEATTNDDVDSIDLWDSALHREIAAATGNPALLMLFDQLNSWRYDHGVRRLRLNLRARASVEAARAAQHVQHRAILAAIASRDEDGAEQAMRAHLGELRNIYERHSLKETSANDL